MNVSAANAIVLAAGRGTRMRHLSDSLPKPLVPVAGKALIDHVLDDLAANGVGAAVVNVHYLADALRAHLALRSGRVPRILISDETDALLDTGGGVARALPLLGDAPFFVANSDVVRRDRGEGAVRALRAAWDDAAMDALLLVHPMDSAVGFDGRGDFFLGADRRLRRRGPEARAPYVYAGLCLCHPRLFAGAPTGAFSMNLVWDRALAAGRLNGLAHTGAWLHVGTPEALAAAEAALVA